MRRTRVASILLLVLICAGAALADNITGTVTNGTTGKPAAGVAVTLVDPMGGMAEVATAKADAQGRFTFSAPAAQGPRLVRAEKSGVNYFKMITPGSTSVDLNVYRRRCFGGRHQRIGGRGSHADGGFHYPGG